MHTHKSISHEPTIAVAYTDGLCYSHEWVMSHIWVSRTHPRIPSHVSWTYECRHVHGCVACHTLEWVTSTYIYIYIFQYIYVYVYIYTHTLTHTESRDFHEPMSSVKYTDRSRYTLEWATSHPWLSHTHTQWKTHTIARDAIALGTTHEWVTAHTQISHVPHTWMEHVTHTPLCHTHDAIFLSLSHTHTHTHTHMHTHTYTRTHTHTYSKKFSVSLSLSLTHAHTHIHTYTYTHTHTEYRGYALAGVHEVITSRHVLFPEIERAKSRMSALLHKSAAMGSKSLARSLAGLKGVTKGVCVHLYVYVGLFCREVR